MTRHIHTEGIELIKRFEGFEPKAYLDAVGVPTIGYGHTRGVDRADVSNGRRIDATAAEALLREDLATAESAVERLIEVDLNENQFAALVSFTFNLGQGNLRDSTLRARLNAGDQHAVPAELSRWTKAGGRTLPGLVWRRAAEAELYARPVGTPPPGTAPSARSVAEAAGGAAAEPDGRPYLRDRIDLRHGSVDDQGDARYQRLSQNVPDGYVADLQRDLNTLGFGDGMSADGAFGNATEDAVKAFRRAAGLPAGDVADAACRYAIDAWLRHGYSRTQPPGAAPAPAPADSGRNLILPRVPHFSQGDPRWADRVLGRGSSIQRQGCAISCIAMILAHLGRDATPGSLDAFLDANNGYANNSVIWNIAGRYGARSGERLKYVRKSGEEAKLRATLLDRLARNLPTMMRVDYAVDADLTYNHFVLCVGVTDAGDFIINDPATRLGDGYEYPGPDNLLQKTRRKGGYKLVKLDWYERVDAG